MVIKDINIKEISKYCFNGVFRTSIEKPGFVHLDFGTQIDSYKLRAIMVGLKKELSKFTTEKFKKALKYQWLGRFDQQVSTKYHLDNAGDQSFLMLGYEPSEIESELFLADYVKFSQDYNIEPSDYFNKYNPIFSDHETILKPYVTEIKPFKSNTCKIVLINNSNSKSESETLGLLHMARITKPDKSLSRVINSMMLSMTNEVDEHETEINEIEFKTTDKISK